MRECFVRISHAMRIVFLLYSVSAIVGCVEQLSREPIGHRFLAASARVSDDPANCQSAATFLMNFDWNLIRRSTYTSGLHFDRRPYVFDCALKKLQRFIAGL